MFGHRLLELLALRNLTQIEIAHRLGVTGQCVTQWITRQSVPHGDRLSELAKVLQVQVSDLFQPPGSPLNAEPVHKMEELLVLRVWRQLDAEGRAAMLAAVPCE